MNDTLASPQDQTTEKTQVNDVRSMLLPLEAQSLLLPGVAVAEIIQYLQPERATDAPEWFMGTITWRKREVPVVSFAVLNGKKEAAVSRHQHIAVLNNTGVNDGLHFIAIVIQGIPRLLRITPKDITTDNETELSPMELLAVKLGDDTVFVPNVTELEKACLTYYVPAIV